MCCLSITTKAFILWLLLAGSALAQNVTVIGPITPGDIPQFNSTTVIKDSGLTAASLGGALLIPSSFGAKCDGSTDDTTAFQNLAAAAVAAGGATVEMPKGATCVIYNSGQSVNGNPLFQLNTGSPFQLKSFVFHGNGSTFSIGHNFLTSEQLQIFNVVEQGDVQIDGINVTQAVPVTLGASPYGTVIISAVNNSGNAANNSYNISLTNSVLTGGQNPISTSNANGVYLNNVRSIASFYGILGLDGTTDLFARNVYCSGCERDIFLKGTTNADISVSSVNPFANSVLLSADANSAVLENIRINYKVFARTIGSSPASYVTIGPTTSLTGTIYRNFNITVNIDMSGDAAGIPPILKFTKNTTSSLGSKFENIVMNGRVIGVPHFTGSNPVFDIFTVADQPWSGETANNIVLRDIMGSGDTSPVFYVDYAPFVTATPGAFVLKDFIFPGNYTDANNTNVAIQRFADNAVFANLILTFPFPLPTRAGDLAYYNGTTWVTLPGNNAGTLSLVENSSGVPSWASASGITLTAGTGISFTSGSTCTTACTVNQNNSMGANKYQVFTSGSGTITTPTGAAWVKFTIVGGGGGGSGGGSGSPGTGTPGNPSCINTSGSACSTPVYQAGGGGGGIFSTGFGGTGGTVSGSGSCTDSVAGGDGVATGTATSGVIGTGNSGGNSSRGGAGARVFGNTTGASAPANSGSGGQGGGAAASTTGGAGGAAGATCWAFVQTPAGSYTYTVGASAAGGTAGTSGQIGGAGGSGIIIAEFGFN